MKSSTLQIKFPFGQTFVLAALILALLLGLLEGAARLLLDGQPTAIGSDNALVDVKFGVLDRLAEEQGGVDCIFLGSSVVLNGIHPKIFEAAYRDRTGESITCYNFGVLALTASGAGVLAEVLVERYHPRLLVYGLTVRELAEGASDAQRVHDEIAQTPWIAFQRGSWNVEGWLVEHSAAYRHYLAYRAWMSPDFPTRLRDFTDAPVTGYQPFLPTRAFDPAAIDAPEYFTSYHFSPVEWAGLERIVAQQSATTQVLLVEMPLPDFFRAMFEGGAGDYQAVIDQIADYAVSWGVPLWNTSTLGLIPDNGWAEDAHHVNNRGARIFSEWLGRQVGQAVTAGQWADPGGVR